MTGRRVKKRTLLSWSSGKDSAWALHVLRRDPTVEVVGLFSVLNERFNRVSMHSTRAELLRRQAEAAGLPLDTINLPDPCTNEQCDAIMGEFVAGLAAKGIEGIAFGDLFLEDVRQYRERQMRGTGLELLFPLWKVPTGDLAEEMLGAGVEAYISSVDLKKLPADFAGRLWSRKLLKELPTGMDPCGENGEFHTVVVGGPMFEKRIRVDVGDVVQRDGFAFADIIPVDDVQRLPVVLMTVTRNLKLWRKCPMSASLRLPFDRRSGSDRRLEYNPDYLLLGGTERRRYEDRRTHDERRGDWIRVSEWSSVWREMNEV